MRQAARRRRWTGAVTIVVLAAFATATIARSPSAPPPVDDFVGLGDPIAPAGVAAGRPLDVAAGRGEPAPHLLAYDAGCIDLSSASTLTSAMRDGFGPLVAFDGVHATALSGGGQFWIVQDAYLNFTGAPPVRLTDLQYTNNVAVAFDEEGCGTVLVQRPNENRRVSFEYGVGEVTRGRFFWPLGITERGGVISVVWSSMELSDEEPDAWEGIARHPVDTWIATYDPANFGRMTFDPATAPGVDPQWGFEVETDDEWTYLFANANLLNLARSGGVDAGPHPSTQMFVGRVPAGDLSESAAVWDGDGWVPIGRASPASISTRGYFANQMHPRRIGDLWVSVTALEEFWGDEMVVDVASAPQGPWYEAQRIDLDRDRPDADQVSYHPTLLPVADGATSVPVVVSYNAAVWDEALADAGRYRPEFVDLDLADLRGALARAETMAVRSSAAGEREPTAGGLGILSAPEDTGG